MTRRTALTATASLAVGALVLPAPLQAWDDTVLTTPNGRVPFTILNGRHPPGYYLYRDGSQLYLYKRSDGSHTALQVSYDTRYCYYAMGGCATQGTSLWVVTGCGPVTCFRAYLSGPWGAAVTLGGEKSRPGDLAVLQSGSLAVVWHEHDTSNPLLHVSYRTTGGVWTTQDIATQRSYSSYQTIVQHPVDGAVWVFHVWDSGSYIYAYRFTDDGTGLTLTDTYLQYLDCDPEYPTPAAIADGDGIAIVYQDDTYFGRTHYQLPSGEHTYASGLTLARIAADGTPTYYPLDAQAERAAQLGIAEGGWAAYRRAQATDYNDVYVAQHTGGAWTTPAHLETMVDNVKKIGYGDGPRFYVHAAADNALHEVEG